MKHCHSTECKTSAELLCEHEQVLTAQYLLDQYKKHCMYFSKQDNHREYGTHMYPENLCISRSRDMKTNDRLNEFFIIPCHNASFRNNQVCTQTSCCSFNHQLFDNHTRAGTGHANLS